MLLQDLKFMSEEEIVNFLQQRKSGVFTKVKYATKIDENTFKIVEMVVRFKINYYHMEKVMAKRKNEEIKANKTNNDIVLLNFAIYENTNTKKKRLKCFTTKHRAKSTFYHLGNEISKQSLIDMGIIKEKAKIDIPCFDVCLDNILALG